MISFPDSKISFPDSKIQTNTKQKTCQHDFADPPATGRMFQPKLETLKYLYNNRLYDNNAIQHLLTESWNRLGMKLGRGVIGSEMTHMGQVRPMARVITLSNSNAYGNTLRAF
jgi:hypothetical protein